MVVRMVNFRLIEDVGTRERVSSQCTHHGIVRSASLAVKHFTLAFFPDNDDRSHGSGKTALNTFLGHAIAEDRQPPSPPIRNP
jgi:hypothetical protein